MVPVDKLLKKLETADSQVANLCANMSIYLETIKNDKDELLKIQKQLPVGNVGHLVGVEISWRLSMITDPRLCQKS